MVVGQPDMVSSIPNNAFSTDTTTGIETPLLCTEANGEDANTNPTYPTFCNATVQFPRFALSDGTRLFIADGGNDRVLEFTHIPTRSGEPRISSWARSAERWIKPTARRIRSIRPSRWPSTEPTCM